MEDNIVVQYNTAEERNEDIYNKCANGYVCTKIYGGLNGEPIVAEYTKEICWNCKFFHKLRYNFQKAAGFQEGYCCDMLLKTEEPDDNIDCEPWVQEVTLDSMCEMFIPKDGIGSKTDIWN